METRPETDSEFVAQHTALVKGIAQKVRSQLDLNCDLDDLIAYGFHGLVEARQRFDPERGIQFSTFAYYRVRGAILDGVRKMAFLPKRAHARLRAAQAANLLTEDAAGTEGQRHASGDTVQQCAQSLHGVLGRMTAAYVTSALGQSEESQEPSPEQAMQRSEQANRLRRAMESLPEREKALVHGFYFADRNFDDVAAELGISKSWASRIHSKALDLLRDALKDLE